MNKQCVNCPGRTDHDTADCKTFSPHSAETIQRLRETFEVQEKASGRSVELDESGDYIDPTVFFGWFGAVNGLSSSSSKHRPEFLAQAESCGARITGKPDGSEPIEVVFTVEAWRAFDVANRASLPVGVPDGYVLVPVEPNQAMLDAAMMEHAQDAVYRAMVKAAPTVTAEQVQAGADWVMRLLDTGEWHLTRFRNDPSMTEGYCRRNSWQVERQCAPYCGDNDVTFWRAETAEQAFIAAINDLFPGQLAEFGKAAPSLPAAGSAVEEVEVVGYRWKSSIHTAPDLTPYAPASTFAPGYDYVDPLMTVAQHQRIVAALSAQQSTPERTDGWISVSERLPDVAQEVIVDSEFDGVTAGFLDSYGEWYSPNSDYKLTRVVAWQPLPAAPSLLASHAEGGKV